MKRLAIILLVVFTTYLGFANDMHEKWHTHFSYYNTKRICATENKVFGIANNHLYAISKEDGVIDTYTKLDGFSENEVKEIQYSKEYKSLIIVYTNSNIDILDSNGNIYNIPDLYQKKISLDKTVNQITIDKEYAYLATNFGIVVVNIKKKEIANTYYIGPDATKVPVYGIAIDEEYIYALSNEYVFKAKKEGTNLLDYNFWQEEKIDLDTSTTYKSLYKFANSLFTVKSDSIVCKYDTKWSDFYNARNYAKISTSEDRLLISAEHNGLIAYKQDLSEDVKLQYYTLDTEYDKQTNTYYFAANTSGIIRLNSNLSTNAYTLPGPKLTDGQRLVYSGDRMYYLNGRGHKTDRGYKTPIISYVEDKQWRSLLPYDMGLYDFIEYAYDATSVATDPKDKNHWFFSTFGEGVFEVRDNKITAIYNHITTNGEIQSANHFLLHYNRCDGLKFDSYGNLYTCMSSVDYPISIYNPTNGWKHLIQNKTAFSGWANGFVFTSKYRVLFETRSSTALLFWKDNKTPFDPTDDPLVYYPATSWIDKDGKPVNPTLLFDAQEDKNGTLWLGTDMGPILLPNADKIFTNTDYRCARVKINRNDDSGLADYLLDGEPIHAIEIDFGNRKWLATANSGLYLISEDGTETLEHFTKENSPLSSNSISDIELNPKTGELFIATPEGVYTYKTDSTEPVKEATKETIYAYPNPVRPEYSGDVIISGLENNSLVWITDSSGDLVFKGRTVGGSISWNCKNRTGQDVSGGVYMVLVSNENSDKPKSVATKILIVR
jgi:hypothetical protein